MEQHKGHTAVDQPDLDLRNEPGIQEIDPVATIVTPETSTINPDTLTPETTLGEEEITKNSMMRKLGTRAVGASKQFRTSAKEFMVSPEKKALRSKVAVLAVATAGTITGVKYYGSRAK